MKKIIAVFAAILITGCLCSCSSQKTTDSSDLSSTTSPESSQQEQAIMRDKLIEEKMEDDFTDGISDEFFASSGWSNGDPFNCTWSDENAVITDGTLKLTIDKIVDGLYRGGEYRSYNFYGYGLYEVNMKAISNPGVVSSFFTYTGPSEENPWDEIDIEILGKNSTQVQFNYYTNGVGGHEYIHDLGFDSSEDFHTYAFLWEENKITWYVDGEEIYSATENLPVTPGRIMMNAWNGIGVDSWLSKYDGTTPLTAEYKWVRFTPIDQVNL